MRNVNRIEPFCDQLAAEWKENVPDWRFGQLMSNFLGWVAAEKKCDPFYIEDNEMASLMKKFFGDI